MKVIIVGGVAGGASCAARLRRRDEQVDILMVERGPYVSYANCGLPYHVGDVINKEASLLVASAQMFCDVFAIEGRTNCEALAIAPQQKAVDLRLAPGASGGLDTHRGVHREAVAIRPLPHRLCVIGRRSPRGSIGRAGIERRNA
jgi:NADPH-dependent 2,4-dienoyl-CoA reductase/sulfur reductase-like enzyme